ncbi:hypothetical protein ACFL35_17425 [Candidatus Riflebacteria bacterium]
MLSQSILEKLTQHDEAYAKAKANYTGGFPVLPPGTYDTTIYSAKWNEIKENDICLNLGLKVTDGESVGKIEWRSYFLNTDYNYNTLVGVLKKLKLEPDRLTELDPETLLDIPVRIKISINKKDNKEYRNVHITKLLEKKSEVTF